MKKTEWNNRLGTLRVSDNRRFLCYDDGKPFFWLGDTAWELLRRLDRKEARHYLENRAAKGFTVIQAVALGELGGDSMPNPYGEHPLIGGDPSKPNPKYFDHVDYIVKCAENLGLYIGLLPTWGHFWKILNRDRCLFTAESAFAYGRYVGERYGKSRNIIWILGGDQNIECDKERELIEQMARGLKAGDGGAHLMTFHPRGPGRSAEFLGGADWMDFNMCQSSHGARDHDNGYFIEQDLAREPLKPSVDGEPRYETIPVGFYYANVNHAIRFDDYDVRQAAYWALFSGALGHTYGNNNIWQMYSPGREPVIAANNPWYDSLDTPGAFQMGLMRKLFESCSFDALRPAPEFIIDAPSTGGAKVKALLSEQGNLALVYSPRGNNFTVDKSRFKPREIKEYWYDPRYGTRYHIHSTANAAFQTYEPPTSGRGNDWILLFEE